MSHTVHFVPPEAWGCCQAGVAARPQQLNSAYTLRLRTRIAARVLETLPANRSYVQSRFWRRAAVGSMVVAGLRDAPLKINRPCR